MGAMTDSVEAALLRVVRHMRDGELKLAMEGCSDALRIEPQCAPAIHFMGLISNKMGDQGLAINLIERAHGLEPEYREYPATLAYLYATVGRLADSLYYAKLATALAPHPLYNFLLPDNLPLNRAIFDHVGLSPHGLVAQASFDAGGYADTVRQSESELRINPENYDVMILGARALHALGQHDSALAQLRAAIHLRPNAAAAYRWLGDVLLALGEHDQALAAQRTAQALDPEDGQVAAHVLTRLPWHAGYESGDGAAFADSLRARVRNNLPPLRVEPPRSDYVGVMWDDCHSGPLVDFILPVLQKMEGVILYRLSRRGDGVTEAARSAVMRYQECSDLDVATFERIIVGDRPAVLVNLCHTGDESRFPSFVGLVAPRVVQWIGLPAADRIANADLVISCPATSEVDRASFDADAIVTLPQLLAWRFPGTEDEAERISPLPRERSDSVMFGGTGDMRRVTPETVALWSSVLHAVPGSQLTLATNDLWPQGVADRLFAMFANCGVVNRITLQKPAPRAGAVNLAFLHGIDILLDSAPVNGFADIPEALWMGVPVVTLRGSHRAGCIGAAILEAAGRPEWVAHSRTDYVAIARRLAHSGELPAVRAGLRTTTAESPLCDVGRFATDFKAAMLAKRAVPLSAA